MSIDIYISIVALLISTFTLFKDYLSPATVEMFVGDSLQIVFSDRNKIHINFNFTNPRNKLSVINRIQAKLLSPKAEEYNYEWSVFYRLEGNKAVMDRYPTSIAVLPKSSAFQGVEFISDNRFKWAEGTYEFTVDGWFNRGIVQKSNMSKLIKFSIGPDDMAVLNDESIWRANDGPRMYPIRITN